MRRTESNGQTVLLRTWVLIGYGVAVVAAIVLQIVIPSLAPYFFFGFLSFLVISFFLFRLPSMNRPIGGTPSASTVPAGFSGAPAITGLGFCMHCGAYVSPSTPICPECGRPVSS